MSNSYLVMDIKSRDILGVIVPDKLTKDQALKECKKYLKKCKKENLENKSINILGIHNGCILSDINLKENNYDQLNGWFYKSDEITLA